jgi:HEAT repeat protein
MHSEFDEVLNILADSSRPLPVARFADLSDMGKEELARFVPVWESLPAERRRALIRQLGDEAYTHVELNFDEIYRVGLDDPDPIVLRSAIDNLWECEDADLARRFLGALHSNADAGVRQAAAAALGHYVFMGEVEQISATLLHDVEEELLAAAVSDQALEVRRAALESLGFSSRAEVPAIIVQAHESGSEPFIVSSLVAIARSANNEWRERVHGHLNNPSPSIRLAAVRAAGELELSETVPELIELLEDVNDEVRRATIWSLGQLGGEAAKQVLGDLLDSSEDDREVQLVQDALDNLAFVDGTRDLLMFDFDDPDAN